ncbi:bone morphogenetic protein 4 [Denticeps clupeoides]|uniref:TGF-beta family profile domain-containing protein n=1 Tax=Denticeps clupeoides TaxID=299321 RepID=A0AAY4AK65_9TELE|nr:bone morphogenetic protein 4-like [Denticeps clupeoides]
MQSWVTRAAFFCLGLLLACSSPAPPLPASRDAFRGRQLEALKASILSYLGMEGPPEAGGRASGREMSGMLLHYRDTVRQLRANASGWREAQAVRSASAVLQPASVDVHVKRKTHVRPGGPWFRAVFDKSPVVREALAVARAELRIYRERSNALPLGPGKARRRMRVTVFETGGVPFHHEDRFALKNPAAETTLDISEAVEKWVRRDANSSLVVEVGLAAGERMDPGVPDVVLELDLITSEEEEEEAKPRQARSAEQERCDEGNKCCRRSLSVSIREIGWSDWVVAPSSYNMYFCDGSCPHNYKPASMHTQVKSRMHHMTKGATPQPCCVPAAYEPMVLLHYDSRGKLKLTPFEDLIVSECFCA